MENETARLISENRIQQKIFSLELKTQKNMIRKLSPLENEGISILYIIKLDGARY